MKIIISDIPGDFPLGYSEQINLQTRSVRIGRTYTIIDTAKSHKVLYDQRFRKRKIQSIFYDKYTIQLVTTESVDIDRINMANTISIIQDSGEIHTAEIIDFAEGARMQDSELRLFDLVYINLTTKQTIDYLSNETIGSSNTKSYFEYYNTDTETSIKIRSLINLNSNVTNYEFTENNENYISMRSSESAFETVIFTGYVNEDEKNAILKYTNFTNLSYLNIGDYDGAALTTYQAIEVPEIIIEDSELEGLYPVLIILRYNQILKYPYEIVESLSANPTFLGFVLAGGVKNSIIAYTGAGDWIISSEPAWTTTVKTTNNLKVTVGVSVVPRSGSIILESSIDPSVTVTISINQSDV